jgi:hypothetical protein
MPIRGAAALSSRADELDVVIDDDGRPNVLVLPIGPIARSAAGALERSSEPVVAGLAVPCAIAGDEAFCPDRGGAIHRAGLSGGQDRVVASSRPGSRLAAALLGGAHSVYAYLASRQTSEGWVSEAWIGYDDQAAVRLSEDGSGATAVALAPKGASLMALIVDARAALTAMHTRTVDLDRGLRLGEDVVVFVGGPGDRRTAAALALPPTGPAWGLLPISKDVGDFGLAIVKLEDPPKVEEPVVWSMYPNGLDPAPIAVAVARERTWVARVRPQSAEPSSGRALELGEVRDGAGFVASDVLPTAATPSDVSLAVDSRGALWVAWMDAAGSWVERVACR